MMDTDTKLYQNQSSSNVLERAAKAKKDNYLKACLARRRSFMPIIYSVDGMACKEVNAYKKRIVSLLTKKWERPYSEMVGYVHGRMGIAIIRSNTMMLCGHGPINGMSRS